MEKIKISKKQFAIYMIVTFGMAWILQVYEKTETIWLPSLMHGATNAFTIFVYLVKPEYSNMAILGPAYIGMISMIPMIIVAVIICVKKPRKKEGVHYVTYQ